MYGMSSTSIWPEDDVLLTDVFTNGAFSLSYRQAIAVRHDIAECLRFKPREVYFLEMKLITIRKRGLFSYNNRTRVRERERA